jgi:hypothetical protein
MKTILFGFTLILTFLINSQTLQITDQYVIGGDFTDGARGAVRINNNTILGGVSFSGISGDKTSINYGGSDVWVVSVDDNNSIEWQNSFGGNSNDQFVKIIETLDGNLIIGIISSSGSNGNKTAPNKGGYDFWVVKIDFAGNEIWQQSYGGSGDDFFGDIIELSDSSLLLVGSSDSPISGDKTEASYGQLDPWIVNIDPNGNILWDKTIGGSGDDRATSVALDENENIYISGSSNSPVSGYKTEASFNGSYDIWIAKLDHTGTFLWDKTIGGDENEFNSDLIFSNNQIYATGSSLSGVSGTKSEPSRGSWDYWVTKLDKDGNILIDKTYGGNGLDELNNSKLLASGELILVGVSDSDVSGEIQSPAHNNSMDFLVFFIDTNDLTLKGQFMFGGDNTESKPSVLELVNNSLLLFGESNSGVSGSKTEPNKGLQDFWALELSTDLSIANYGKEETLSIYPNPTSKTFKVSNLPSGENYNLTIFDRIGKVVFHSTVDVSKNSVDVSSLQSGMYTLLLYDGGKRYTSKLIVE